MASNRFAVDYAKRVAGCKKCKQQLAKGEMRLAKISPNPFVQNPDGGPPPDMKQYFHPKCLFETFSKARATTKIIDEVADIEGYGDLEKDDKTEIVKLIDELEEQRSGKGGAKTPKKTPARPSTVSTPSSSKKKPEKEDDGDRTKVTPTKKKEENGSTSKAAPRPPGKEDSKHNQFLRFCKLCETIAAVSKYTDKSAAVKMYISKDGYDGDMLTLFKLLLPSIDQRVYNLKEKQLIKLFAGIWDLNADELTEHYNESGDVSMTLKVAFEKNGIATVTKSDWSIMKVDRWLDKLGRISEEAEQTTHLAFAAKRMSPLELQYLLRLIKKDLRITAGVKHILDGLHPSAYEAFQSCRDLADLVGRKERGEEMPIGIRLGTPVLPMLAEACKSVEQAMSSCKGPLIAEIKYDGERVQLHKDGDDFSFYSRSLKPVQEYKMEQLHEVVKKAFPGGDKLILDSEVLLVDTTTGQPLPFGTLGKHKKEHFKDASVCLFVFDILMYNDESVLNRPLAARKHLLQENMTEVKHRVHFSHCETVKHGDKPHLNRLIFKAIDDGLEGLVIKDSTSIYEPGKRHWLKVKKDYLEQGSMADTADLLVLGAYYGTGSKGGLMSVFLMGVRDEDGGYRTVTKCGNGHTDEELERINKELKGKMKKISRVPENVPNWLQCSRQHTPDFVFSSPDDAPVWEITGAEFTRSDHHTADGISIRFPRVTRIRKDKSADSATSLEELKKLFETSKQKADFKEEENGKEEEDETPLYQRESQIAGDEELEGGEEKKTPKRTEKLPIAKASSEKKKKVEREEEESPKKAAKKRPSANDKDEEEEKKTSKGKPSAKRPRKAFIVESDEEESEDSEEEEEEEEDEEKESKPKRKEPCRYGAGCYRKNAEHLRDFSHPAKK